MDLKNLLIYKKIKTIVLNCNLEKLDHTQMMLLIITKYKNSKKLEIFIINSLIIYTFILIYGII